MIPKELIVAIAGKDYLVRRVGSGEVCSLVIHDDDHTPFAAVIRRREEYKHVHWLVSCTQRPEGLWYAFGMDERDEATLGVSGSHIKSLEVAKQIALAFFPADPPRPLPAHSMNTIAAL